MPPFELTDDLITGVADIDDQHRMLFRLANQVVDPSYFDQGPGALLGVLAFLGGYVDYHFAAEEHAMQIRKYAHYEQHRAWHDLFRREVGEIAQQAACGWSEALGSRISVAVRDWLTDHIRVPDRHLAYFLVEEAARHSIRLANLTELAEAGAIPPGFAELYKGIV